MGILGIPDEWLFGLLFVPCVLLAICLIVILCLWIKARRGRSRQIPRAAIAEVDAIATHDEAIDVEYTVVGERTAAAAEPARARGNAPDLSRSAVREFDEEQLRRVLGQSHSKRR